MALAGGVPGWLITLFIVLMGLAFGSFLNVCISRLPRHESIIHPRSRCPRCGVAIRNRDIVPILSWLLLRGRCRNCGWPIPWRYPAVEFATTALFLLCFLRFGSTPESIGMAVLCFLLLGLAVMDEETMRLPDAFTWTGIGLGIAYSGLVLVVTRADCHPSAIDAMLFAAIWAAAAAALIFVICGLYWLVRRREGMGLGDAKLLAMIAAWLGPALTLLTLFLGVLSATIVGAIWIAMRGRRGAMAMRLPFGSFLCAAAIYAIFAGEPILAWYLKFFH